jgi:carbonic anhydrase/acetyltransferase-like protein (isoleucine patch superfamily)
MVAAGSVVKPGFEVPAGKLVGGVPAKIIRDLTKAEYDDLENSAYRYKKYTEITIESLKNGRWK